MNWKAVCLVLVSYQLSGLLGGPLRIILSPDEASKILTREAKRDFNDGIKKFLNTKVDVSKTVYDNNDVGPPALPQKRSELLGRIKTLVNSLSENSKKGIIPKKEENGMSQDSKAQIPNDEDSMGKLENMVDNLIKEIQTERKRGVGQKIVNLGRSAQKWVTIGRQDQKMVPLGREVGHRNVGQETLNKIQALVQKLKRANENARKEIVSTDLTNIASDLADEKAEKTRKQKHRLKLMLEAKNKKWGRNIANRAKTAEEVAQTLAQIEKMKKMKEAKKYNWGGRSIETGLAKKVTNDENLVESAAIGNEEKKIAEMSSQSNKVPKDRRELMKELLDTYNEMMGKGNKRTDKYAKELDVESQSIVPKPNSDNNKVSKETAKAIGGFSVISDDTAKKESVNTMDLSAEEIINKAREILKQEGSRSNKLGPK